MRQSGGLVFFQHLPEIGGKEHIVKRSGLGKERSDLSGAVSRNAASDGRHQKQQLLVLPSVGNKPVDRGANLLKPLHRRNGVRLTLHSLANAPDSAEMVHSKTGGPTAMMAIAIAAKDKDLVVLQTAHLSRRHAIVSKIYHSKAFFSKTDNQGKYCIEPVRSNQIIPHPAVWGFMLETMERYSEMGL